MAVSGLAVGYTLGGFVLFWAGLKNQSPAQTIKDLLSGNLSALNTEGSLFSATPPTVGVENNSASGSGSAGTDTSAASGSRKQNATTIYNYMRANGYTSYAAAGIVTCIDGESSCDPESVGSGGAGLIAWTPPSKLAAEGGTCHKAGIGNASTSADMDSQLKAIIKYNNGIGSNYIRMLNAQTSIQSAADVYSQYFEKPAATDSDVHAAGIALAKEVSGLSG